LQLADFSVWGRAFQAAGAVIITASVAAALISLIVTRQIPKARLLLAEGIIMGLSVMVSGTLLRVIALDSWKEIQMFTVILSLRILLKKVFVWEEARLRARLEREWSPSRPSS
jgi:Ca2+/Na+ antiporter